MLLVAVVRLSGVVIPQSFLRKGFEFLRIGPQAMAVVKFDAVSDTRWVGPIPVGEDLCLLPVSFGVSVFRVKDHLCSDVVFCLGFHLLLLLAIPSRWGVVSSHS